MGQYEFPNPEWSEVSEEGKEPACECVCVCMQDGLRVWCGCGLLTGYGPHVKGLPQGGAGSQLVAL